MRCAKCNYDNPADALFCMKCGTKVENRCSSCDTVHPADANFCRKCGGALRATATASSPGPAAAAKTPRAEVIHERQTAEGLEGERKTVTALFADIKGSTELMEDLDPEEARAVIDPALKFMIEAVRRYDGYVVQSTGDGIFALFGAPAAHEDHPQRALYAALRMQEELEQYSAKVVAEGSSPIQARIGINTGEVVVRSITTGADQTEYTPIGHTTNLASRMQTAAPVGSVAVSENTRRLCEGYFILRPLGATRVKGVSEPVNVYEVTGLGPLRTRLQLSAGRGLTKFVGREREMEVLRHAAEQAMSGHGQIVAALAEPGVGKSRLYFEFKAASQSGWMVLETVSVSHGKASAYLPVIDLLRNYFRIASEDDERTRREKVAGRIAILDRTLEDSLPYLLSLLGIAEGDDPLVEMEGQIKKRRTLEAIKRILLRESLNQPLMVIFEDLHWIDEATQEFLNLLADSLGTTKILLLVNYRPEYSHQWGNKTYYTQLRLDPLGKGSAEEMLSALLGDGKDLLPLKRLVIERTEGIPFFMEEIVQSLFEDGVLARNGVVKLAKSMNAVKVPTTVQAILAARIDRLPPDEKELLQTLAVTGREFALSLVRRVVDGKKDDELERMLGNLQIAEFIYEQPATGDIEYIFKHALTQEVAYNSILIERRKALHERTGDAIEASCAKQLDDYVDELAHHYDRAGNVGKAAEYFRRAGTRAAEQAAYSEAIKYLTRALKLLRQLPDNVDRARHELELQMAMSASLHVIEGAGSPEREKALTRAQELCERLSDRARLIEVLLGLSVLRGTRGDHSTAYEVAQKAMTLAEQTKLPSMLAAAHSVTAVVGSAIGEFESSREHCERAIELFGSELLGNFGQAAIASQAAAPFLGLMLAILGYAEKALAAQRKALAAAQRRSNTFANTSSLVISMIARFTLRDTAGVGELAEELLSIPTEQLSPSHRAFALFYRSWVMACSGQVAERISEMRHILTEPGLSMSVIAYLRVTLVEVYGASGMPKEGLVMIADGLSRPERNVHAEFHRLKGELTLMSDPQGAAKAERSFREAIEIARQQAARLYELRARMSLARLLASQGRREEAYTTLAEIYNWFTEGFDTADLKDAKALLDELSA